MTSPASNEFDKAQNKVRSEAAQDDVKENLTSLKDDVAALASSVKRLAEAEFGSSTAEIQEAAEKRVGDIEASIRKNPTQAALIAAGAGFLIGLIIAR